MMKHTSALNLSLLALLSACAVGPDFTSPDAPNVTHYTNGTDPTEATSQHFSAGAKIDADWWRLFKSPQLDAVMDEAMMKNPGLEAAQANLRQSQNNLRSGYGIFFPQIDGSASATRQKFTSQKLGQNSSPSIFNLFTLSATVSYTLDVFGGERRMIEGLEAEVDFEQATEQATYLTLSTTIANTVIAKAAYHDNIVATEQLIDLEKEQVNLATIQEKSGIVPYFTVLALSSQLDSSEATIPQLQQKIAQSDDLLATLAGHVPAEWNPPEVDLATLHLPTDLPVSLPSDLVRQRPDILAAEAVAHSASAAIGAATAAMLPNITLNGSYGTNSTKANTLFAANGNFWSMGAGATMPLFDGGTLWFKRKAAMDNYQQAMASYRQVVLNAFGQVADTLHALDHDATISQAEEHALAAATETLHLAQVNYKAGLTTYLDVLNADIQYHQALINDLQATALRYQDTTALFAALGGGWWNAKQE